MNTFKFILRDPSGSVTFGAEMVKNWDATKLAITRNKTYRGAFLKLTTEFEFTGVIRRRLIRLVDIYGSDVEIYLTIQLGDGNKDAGSFKAIGSGERKADMTTWEPGELVCKLGFVGSGFEETLFNRHDTDTEYLKTESIDGIAIPQFTNEYRTARLHDRVLQLNSELNIDPSLFGEFPVSLRETSPITIPPLYQWHMYASMSLPIAINYASDTDFKTTACTPVLSFSSINSADNFFLLQASEAKSINIDYSINTSMRAKNVRLKDGKTTYELHKRQVDKDYQTKTDTLISTFEYSANDIEYSVPFVYSAAVTEVLEVGDSLQFYVLITSETDRKIESYTFGVNVYGFTPAEASTAIYSESQSVAPATTAPVILPHELFSRFASIYTGYQVPFYSTVFGRVELGYPVDGEWAYLAAANGKMIRDFPFADAKFASNMKEAFEAYNCIGNLAGTIEQTNNGPRFRIDYFENMFDDAVIVSLDDMLAGVTRKLNTESMFGEIIAGYNKIELENLNGLDTFNGDFNFTPPIKSVTTKLDIRCKWITNDYAIEQQRRIQYKNTPKEDAKHDDNIFLLDLKPIQGSTELEAVKDEDYTSVTGILNPSTAYNLRLSPGQNLRRWGNVIHAAMPKGGIIKYSSATKNTDLVTVKDGVTIVENADIDVSTLDNPIYINEEFTINQFPINKDQWTAIESNPRGLFQFKNKGVNLFGYIEDAEYDASKDTGTVKLIRVNR